MTGDPWAGVCEGELFDPTPYAGAYVRYFVRHPTTQLMPRKIKTAFTATDEDRAITGIHDIAFIPRIRDGVRGFEIRVGGGTSIMPRVAPTLYEFVAPTTASTSRSPRPCFRIFDRQDWLRVNRARARIKVLIDKIGIDEFREPGRGGAQGRLGRRARLHAPTCSCHDEEAQRPAVPAGYASPNGDVSEFERFRASNVQAAAPGGLLDRRRSRSTAATSRPSSSAASPRSCASTPAATRARPSSRTCVLRWVRDESRLRGLAARSPSSGLGEAGADEITDVVSCPGTDSCKLGITSSMGLNAAVSERIEEMRDRGPADEAHPHQDVAAARTAAASTTSPTSASTARRSRSASKTIPAYIAHIGGNYEGGEVVYGTRLKVRLPAKRVPDAIERWLRIYEAEREDGEEFNAFAERVGAERFEDEVQDLAHAGRVQPREHELLHRLEPQGAVRGDPGRGRVRGLDASRASSSRRSSEHHPRLALACSFQKEESVLIHMLHEGRAEARVFTIDTGVLFPETYEAWRESRSATASRSRSSTARQPASVDRPENCCGEPQGRRARSGARGARRWITGMRREQSPTRADAPRASSCDEERGIWKFNPLADWTEKDVWALHRTSTTCPTTRCTTTATPRSAARPAPSPGAGREGRWAGQDKTECGLHE